MEGLIKTLADIAQILSLPMVADYKKITITGLAYNSSQIKKNYIFVAIRGFSTDGNQYIEQAINNGAVAIITDKKIKKYNVPVFKITNSREALSLLSDWFYDFPSRKMNIIGITGTNGKTTITYLLEKILQNQGYKTGIIGTIQHKIGKTIIPSHNTTPESLDLNRLFVRMLKSNVEYVLMEVSSHSLVLNRVDFCAFDGAIFSNLTEDHFDFHKNFEQYFQAKRKLFALLKQSPKKNKVAVINVDDKYGNRLFESLKGIAKISYGIKSQSDYQAKNIVLSIHKTSFSVQGVTITTPLIGRFNIYNILSAFAIIDFWNMKKIITIQALAKFQTVRGRLERIKSNKGMYFIDYAHTEDALKNVLETLSELKTKRMITVFGCGGDRDKKKRPRMGAVVSKFSDITIVTSDNPRTESQSEIISDILKGIKDKNIIVIENRRKAIKKAYQLAEKDDIILIAGKGHEDYQILGKKKIHFNDKEEVLKLLK